MSTENTNNSMESEESIEIHSLCDFIRVIGDLTKGTKLYEQVVNRFIEKIKQKSKSPYPKARDYYSSTFLIREAQSIFFAIVNFIDKFSQVNKYKLAESYSVIRETLLTHCSLSETILNNIRLF